MDARVYSVGLQVADYAACKAFYAGALGFPVARAFEDRADHKACFFALAGAPFYIVWDEGHVKGEAEPRVRLDFHVADVQAAWSELSAKLPHAKGPPAATRWGGFGFSVTDPEGTTVHFLQGKK